MRLAVLLTAVPASEDVRTVRQLALAALRLGHQVTVFLNADGVSSATALVDLGEQGASLAACTLSARQRNVALIPGIHWGSQLDWADAVHDADRVVAFG
ncbi:MAG: DsrE family protein [Chloroflexota bacterium]